MSKAKFDSSGMEETVKSFKKFTKEYDSFCRKFLLRQAQKVLVQTKMLTPVKTGDLRNRWELTSVRKVRGGYRIQIFNTLYYASYIEDGHRQKVGRFVPGVFVNGTFQYQKGAKSGIVLKKPFVNGFHMCRISMNRVDETMQSDFNRAFKQFRETYGI